MKKIDEKLQDFLKKRNFAHTVETKQVDIHYSEEELDAIKRILGESYIAKLPISEIHEVKEVDRVTPEELELLMKLDAAEGRDNIELIIKELREDTSLIRELGSQIKSSLDTIKLIMGTFIVLNILIFLVTVILYTSGY